MQFADLANELLVHVFQSCSSIPDVLSLASTCHHFHSVLAQHRLPILFTAAEAQCGPISDAIRVATHNKSQPAHLPRPAPSQSLALLKRLLDVGHVANQWAALYPSQKWRGDDSVSRRLLSSEENYRLRRACYRIWLYTLAFHTPLHTRYNRHLPQTVRTRALLIRPWPSHQLAEIIDLHAIFRTVLESHVCPSNGTVLRRHKRRFPDDPFPVFGTESYARFTQQQAHFHCTPHMSRMSIGKTHNTNYSNVLLEGWGDEIAHYYVVEDMLKLSPAKLMHLFEVVTGQASLGAEFAADTQTVSGSKRMVESYVAGLGEWLENNGETMMETMGFVIAERGEDGTELKERVDEGWAGVIRRE